MNDHSIALDTPEPAHATSEGIVPGWIWAGNPFFIASPVLLLYGLYRLVIDPRFLPTEITQLCFNFGALQLYLALIAATAVFLAGRKLWIDALHLIPLMALLFLSPFILISQSVFLGQKLALSLGLAGAAVSFGSLALLRSRIPLLAIPRSLLAASALFLVVNAAIAPWYRSVLDRHNEAWAGPSAVCWFLFLPALASLVNWVRPHQPGALRGSEWFIAGCLICWTAATALNLWGISYVDDRALSLHLLVPTLWVLAWTAVNRSPAWVLASRAGGWIVSLPAAAAALSILNAAFDLFFLLSLANIAGFALIAMARHNSAARWLLLLSTCCAIASIPVEAGGLVGRALPREFLMGAAFLAGAWTLLFRTSDPRVGILGGILCASGLSIVLGVVNPSSSMMAIAWQAGFVTVMMHSLNWRHFPVRGWLITRPLVAAAWLMHSWMAAGQVPHGTSILLAAGGIVLGACAVARLLGHPIPWTIPAAGLGAAGTEPLLAGASRIGQAPAGLVLVTAAFLLILAGTAFAIQRRNPPITIQPLPPNGPLPPSPSESPDQSPAC